MAYSKEKIYNLALSALLLAREVAEVSTDTSNEVRVLNLHWDTALEATLKDLDLDCLSSSVQLELIAELNDGGPWRYAYKYPTTCAFLRRLKSCAVIDTKKTHIAKKVQLYNGQRAIFTNQFEAVAEILPFNVPLAALSPMAAMALAYQLAWLSAPLIAGKGAKNLKEEIYTQYLIFKSEAQEDDAAENFNFEPDWVRSEFVDERTS